MHAKSDSIMSEGGVVRPHHYVTFLDALKQVSGMPDWDYGADAGRSSQPSAAGRLSRCPGTPGGGEKPETVRCLTRPEPLLLERRVETGEDVYVDRITADGGVWTGGTVTAEISGGEWEFGATTNRRGSARRRSRRTPSSALRAAIAALGLLRHAPRSTCPDAAVIHALAGDLDRRAWTASRHTSTLQARGTTQAEPLTKLAAALEAALEAGE